MPRKLHPRRKDRAIEDDHWIRDFLAHAPTGVLGLLDNAEPYLNPNLFVYMPERHAIYVHTAAAGRLGRITSRGSPGAFTTFAMGRLLPAPRAFSFSVEYESVIAWGPVSLVEDDDETREVLMAIMAKYAPHLHYGKDYEGVTPEDLPKTAVHRLKVERWSAKRNEKPEGFPGAYSYHEVQNEKQKELE